MDEFDNITQTAFRCGVNERTIRNWQKGRAFPVAKYGYNNRLFSRAEVAEWIKANSDEHGRIVRQGV